MSGNSDPTGSISIMSRRYSHQPSQSMTYRHKARSGSQSRAIHGAVERIMVGNPNDWPITARIARTMPTRMMRPSHRAVRSPERVASDESSMGKARKNSHLRKSRGFEMIGLIIGDGLGGVE